MQLYQYSSSTLRSSPVPAFPSSTRQSGSICLNCQSLSFLKCKKKTGEVEEGILLSLYLHLWVVVMMELNNTHRSSLKNTELYKCQVLLSQPAHLASSDTSFLLLNKRAGKRSQERKIRVMIISSKVLLLYILPPPKLTRLSQENAQILYSFSYVI